MTIQNYIVDTGAGKIGQTYQRYTSSLADAYCRGVVGSVVETNTTYSFQYNFQFWYSGIMNFIPTEIGVFGVNSSGTLVPNVAPYTQKFYNISSAMRESDGTTWKWQWIQETTVSLTKTTTVMGYLPYIKIGCINRWGSDGRFNNGDDWDLFGTTYGILVANSVEDANFNYNGTWTYNNKTNSLSAYTFMGGCVDHKSLTYANCPVKIQWVNPIYVYNASSVPRRVSGIYVYNSAGAPKKAKSVTVYGSDGTPKTITMTP